jgi:epoxyqueuosine reductase QueG
VNSPAESIKQQALEMGADAVGIAAVSEFHRHAPEGHRPDDILKGAKSVIAIGKRRYTTGQWLSSNIDTVHRARSGQGGRDAVGMAIASLIEKDHGCASLMISPGMFDTGLVPVMSLKLPAELAGLGTRSMAGGIILSRDHGLMGFVAVVTTMELAPDRPLDEPVCPDVSCIAMYQKTRRTPCMNACRAIDGTIENGRLSRVRWYMQLCATRALTTMNAAYIRLLPEIMAEPDPERRKLLAIGQARKGIEDPPGRGIWGRCIECMRVCPVNRRAHRLQKGDDDVRQNA